MGGYDPHGGICPTAGEGGVWHTWPNDPQGGGFWFQGGEWHTVGFASGFKPFASPRWPATATFDQYEDLSFKCWILHVLSIGQRDFFSVAIASQTTHSARLRRHEQS